MGVITISINDESEAMLRRIAKAKFSKKKGYLSMAITEAIKEWSSKKEEKETEKALDLLYKGKDMGGIISKKREDTHKR